MLNRFALLAAILVTSGYAANQTANAGNLSEVDSDRTDLTWQGLSVDKLEDMDLYNAAGTKIGEVEDVLADGNGKLSAVGVEFTESRVRTTKNWSCRSIGFTSVRKVI